MVMNYELRDVVSAIKNIKVVLEKQLSSRITNSKLQNLLNSFSGKISGLDGKTFTDIYGKLGGIFNGLTDILTELAKKTEPTDVQPVSAESLPLPIGASTETTLASLLGKLDITLSALRDAIKGEGARDFTTLEADIESMIERADVNLSTRLAEATFTDRIGEVQATPTAYTMLARLKDIYERLNDLFKAGQTIGNTGFNVNNSPTVNQPSATDWRVDGRRGATISFASVSVSSSGDNTIVVANAISKIKVLNYLLVADSGLMTGVSVKWKSGSLTDLTGAMAVVSNGILMSPHGSPAEGWLFETAVNQALVLNLSTNAGVRGHISYFLEP
jgi:hypothetical protein